MIYSFSLVDYFQEANQHQNKHKCTSVPYDHGDLLRTLVAATKPLRILELGTGVGYSTACLAKGHSGSSIDTIDENEIHGELAMNYWDNLKINGRITSYCDKAEVVLPILGGPYDMIFFDGKAPSMKFLIQFERLLQVGGLLVTANLFLKDPKGGAYVRQIRNTKKWQTAIFSDTALSVKID